MNNLKKKGIKQKIVKKKLKQQRQDENQLAKQVQFSYNIVQEIKLQSQYYIIGDTVIDIDQLMSLDNIKMISSHNNFRKAHSVRRIKDYNMVEVILDTDAHGIIDMSLIIKRLQQTQNEQHLKLSKLIQDYQNLINKNINALSYYSDCSRDLEEGDDTLNIPKFECKFENQSDSREMINEDEQICDELNGWNYQKSLGKAQKYIQQMYEDSKGSNWFFSYIIFKGRKYDQIKSILGTSQILYKDFMCMDEDQIDYLLIRKPILYPQMMVDQYLNQNYRRIHELIMQFNIQSSHLNAFRQKPMSTPSVDFDIKTVDNLKVCFETEGSLLVLSNYKNKKDDLVLFYKFKPKGNFKAQDILLSQRNFKKGIKFNPYNSQTLSFSSDSIVDSTFQDHSKYVDLRYEAQSELFKEKFYSIIDNDNYHDINFYL